jgi:hypothetical protein
MLANAARYYLVIEAKKHSTQDARMMLDLSERWELQRLYTEMESRTNPNALDHKGQEMWAAGERAKAREWIAAYAAAEKLDTLEYTMTKGGTVR